MQHAALEWSGPKIFKNSMARPKRTTKDKLMDAAEKLFARRGYDGTSLRDITGEAGVDLALVNYYFGSKKELLAEVLDRRGKVLNQERLRRLGEVRMKAAPLADRKSVV
jgi:AcrR family transcriptional regulator